jgi:hypothetical protein
MREKEPIMKPDNQPHVKYDHTSLFIAAILLTATSQAIESIQTPVGNFVHGVIVGMSIVCSVVGLVLYTQSQKKK